MRRLVKNLPVLMLCMFISSCDAGSSTGSSANSSASPSKPLIAAQNPDTAVSNPVTLDDLKKQEPGIIEGQSFEVELEHWGKVRFISSETDMDGPFKVHFYLVDDHEQVVYRFPEFYGNEWWSFEEIRAVSFKDVDKDGLKDIIIIADYITGIGKEGVVPFPVAGIYFQKGSKFVNNPGLDDELNSVQDESIDKVLRYVEGRNKNRPNNQKTSLPSKETSYKITKASFTDKDVIIHYPQITNLNDSTKQKTINEIIKQEALKQLNPYKEAENGFTLEVDYVLRWQSASLLSIQYRGMGNVKKGLYPNNLFYTTNININKGIRLKLKDLVAIDESFIEKFKGANYKIYDPDINVATVIKDYLDNTSTKDWIDYFNNADEIGGSNGFSYLTEDSLGISVDVPHALGDHAEFEIKYKDLAGNMKVENEIWNVFTNENMMK